MARPQEANVAVTGITVLNPELTPNETLVDVVFVHGLRGGPRETWTYRGKERDPYPVFDGSQLETTNRPLGYERQSTHATESSHARSVETAGVIGERDAQQTRGEQGDQLEPKKTSVLRRLKTSLSPLSKKKRNAAPPARVSYEDNAIKPAAKQNEFFWPQHLPETCAGARVMTFGYNSNVVDFFKTTNQNRFYDHAGDLLGALVRKRTNAQDRPIIFVAHSLGGIVVKQMLFDSFLSTEEVIQRQKVYKSTKALFFLGTPHRGSSWAAWGEIATGLAGTIFDTNSALIKHLEVNGEALMQLEKNFGTLIHKRTFLTKTFKEGRNYKPLPLLKSKIVEYATLGDPGREVVFTIDANHTDMVRFWGKQDPNYETVAGELNTFVLQEIAQGQVDANHVRNEEKLQQKVLSRQTLLKDLDYEGRRNRENQIWNVGADPQTVKWIWDSSFVNWTSEAGGLFWICGKPASGKSTLMESIARSPELADRLRCRSDGECTIIRHFFDFRAGKGIGNNFEGFLRSLLYQLVDDSRNHKDVDLDGVDLTKSEPKQQWSIRALKEAMNNVLKQHSDPVCILLDGLDEYEGDKWSLATFVREMANPRVKICIASRPDSAFSITFKDLTTVKMEERNTPAIDTMVRQTIECMTEPGFYDSSTAVELARRISEMAKGVFLWAHFAIKEVRDGLSEGMDLPDLYKKLDNVPQELEKIYSRILEKLKPEDRQKTTHMLQLVCYAQRTLTLGELCVAAAHASSEQGLVVEQISEVELQRFEKKVLALTGGVLEIFPIIVEARAREESWGTDSEILPHGILETHETDLYEGREIDGAESYKIRKVEDLFVSVIHRTFRTYMDSTGWLQLLNARHEGMLHAHVLWLRVCTGVFPASFKGLPPGDHGSKLTQKRNRATLTGSSSVHSNTLFPSRRTLASWPALGETMDSPLLEYAAAHMLAHAFRIEQDLGLRYYEMLQSGMSNSFLFYHIYYTRQCECYFTWVEPPHPLHLAIGHGLIEYVKAYLSMVGDQGSREWDQVSYLEVAKRLPWGGVDPSGTAQMSLLEFAIRHAGKMQFMESSRDLQDLVVAEILDHYPRVDDAAILVALDRCSVRVVHLLLSHLPTGKMALKSGIWNGDDNVYEGISKHEVLVSIQKPFDVGPLWYIARRPYYHVLEDAAELIDLFLGRGEDINEKCGPFGTALHGALLRVTSSNESIPMWDLLVSKGADINAVGPFGTPLAFVWRLANTYSRTEGSMLPRTIWAVEWLIKLRAVNDTYDPNGSIPSRKRMLAFGHGEKSWEWYERVYRGEERDEETEEDEEDERESRTMGNPSTTERGG